MDPEHDWFAPLDPFGLDREKLFFGQRVEIAKWIYGEIAAAIPWEAQLAFRIPGAEGMRNVGAEGAWLWQRIEWENRLQLRTLANLIGKNPGTP